MTGKILIYLDNSNIFLSTKVYSGRRKGLRNGISDESCRLHIDQIVEAVLNGRPKPSVQRAYGVMDEKIVAALRRVGFEVSQSSSSKFTYKEKEADTQLVADAVEDIITKCPHGGVEGRAHDGTVIIFSGDKDMLPLIVKARKYGWQVEVWCYQSSLSDSIRVEKERKVDGSAVEIHELERLFDRCTECSFISWKDAIPVERSFWIKFEKGNEWYKKLDKSTKECLQKAVVSIGCKHFELPVSTIFPDEGLSQKDVFLGVIITIPERKRDKSRIYDFQNDIWSKRHEFERDVRNAFDQILGILFKFYRISVVPYEEHKLMGETDNNSKYMMNGKKEAALEVNASNCGRKGAMCIYAINGKCKYESDSSECYFAHSKSELLCRNCAKKGCHPTLKCKFLKVTSK